MKKSILLFVAISLLLTGCLTPAGKETVSFTKVQAPMSGKSLLYVYRPFHLKRGSVMFNVLVDGEEKGTITRKQYLPIDLAPGSHRVVLESSVAWPKNIYGEFSIDIKAGETLFYRWTPDMIKKAKMVKVDAAAAEKEMAKMTYSKPINK